MSLYIEDYLPIVKYNNLNTKKPVSFQSTTQVAGGTATTAGGALALNIGSAATAPNIYFGSGVPTITAPQGSLYLRTDGSSTSTRAYINTTGSTTWTNITTGA